MSVGAPIREMRAVEGIGRDIRLPRDRDAEESASRARDERR
jgi:hypothetical protein